MKTTLEELIDAATHFAAFNAILDDAPCHKAIFDDPARCGNCGRILRLRAAIEKARAALDTAPDELDAMANEVAAQTLDEVAKALNFRDESDPRGSIPIAVRQLQATLRKCAYALAGDPDAADLIKEVDLALPAPRPGGPQIVYAVGIENAPDEFGMVDGPTPDLAQLLDKNPDHEYDNPDGHPVYVIRFNPDETQDQLYYWRGNCWFSSTRNQEAPDE